MKKILLAAALVGSVAYASPFKVVKTKLGPKTDIIEVLSIEDTGNESLKVVVSACGTGLTFVVTKASANTNEFQDFVMMSIADACR
jgi:hypothetical protein